MHINYCTLFDINYIDKGLAMYESLNRVAEDYTLFIVAFDENTFHILSDMKLKNVCVLQEEDLLDEEMQKVKAERTRAEWCWTCSAVTIDFLMNKYELQNCVYLDSDLYFFANPKVLVEEMVREGGEVLITEHRFGRGIENYLIAHMYGKFCVQFTAFVNDVKGRTVLNWWKEMCIQDCSINGSYEVYGDQKYQDQFEKRFAGVHVLRNEGGGLAPWNIGQYYLKQENGKIEIVNKKTERKFPLIFYHFQGFELLGRDYVNLSVYKWTGRKVDEKLVSAVYERYTQALQRVRKRLEGNYACNFDRQADELKESKIQRKKDSCIRRRMGQILVSILSYIRIRIYSKKDLCKMID